MEGPSVAYLNYKSSNCIRQGSLKNQNRQDEYIHIKGRGSHQNGLQKVIWRGSEPGIYSIYKVGDLSSLDLVLESWKAAGLQSMLESRNGL